MNYKSEKSQIIKFIIFIIVVLMRLFKDMDFQCILIMRSEKNKQNELSSTKAMLEESTDRFTPQLIDLEKNRYNSLSDLPLNALKKQNNNNKVGFDHLDDDYQTKDVTPGNVDNSDD